MSRLLAVILLIWAMITPATAQDFSGLARIDATQSRIIADGRYGARIDLFLSQGVPYRLFTLNTPPRLVLDFQEVDWTGLQRDQLLATDRITKVQFGTYVPGWSRFVADLGGPMLVAAAEMQIDPVTGAAHLSVSLTPTTEDEFAATVGAPHDARWDLPTPAQIPEIKERGPDAPLVVVLDPGHGGLDPGAEAAGLNEKALMLTFARELSEVLVRSGGYKVVLTRDGDYFVSLERRIAIAHQAGADVFISLHADSLAEGQAHGATVHVLARDASDIASAKLAERHDRDDLLAGVDFSHVDDLVTDILLDLARQETQPRTEALAAALVGSIQKTGGPMNRRPLRSAAFSVLKAADVPSVLIEIGFLSNPRDLANIRDVAWRANMAEAIRNGLRAWQDADAAQRPLVRQ